MNIEKVGELAEQAGFMDGWFSESGDDCGMQLMLFTKLIVKECMDVVENQVPLSNKTSRGGLYQCKN